MTSLDNLRRQARSLRRAWDAGDGDARARVAAVLPAVQALKHADALHVLAREQGYDSWPKLKFATEAATLDRAAKAERLKHALYLGQPWIVSALLDDSPDLGEADFGLQCALYDLPGVRARLAKDPVAATRIVGVRSPLLHLAFSQHLHGGGDPEAMMAVAEALLSAGADVNDGYPFEPGAEHHLSALYGALCHGRNMRLGEWLLANGADPNDNESLYHATELGHLDALRLLLSHGARTEGTNALLRALDFDNPEMVRLLLEAGADPNEGVAPHPSGETPQSIPALHQAARRLCSAEIVDLLLAHGADPELRFDGHSAYAMARICGNGAMVAAMEKAGSNAALDPIEAQLARAADGTSSEGDWIDMARLSPELQRLLTRLVWRPGSLPHIKRLVALGFDPNVPDEMGAPPLHLAGWEGSAGENGLLPVAQSGSVPCEWLRRYALFDHPPRVRKLPSTS
ncbi:MAG: ankyrin repeat domain-containing protein [Pseudomonadota bacterium]